MQILIRRLATLVLAGAVMGAWPAAHRKSMQRTPEDSVL